MSATNSPRGIESVSARLSSSATNVECKLTTPNPDDPPSLSSVNQGYHPSFQSTSILLHSSNALTSRAYDTNDSYLGMAGNIGLHQAPVKLRLTSQHSFNSKSRSAHKSNQLPVLRLAPSTPLDSHDFAFHSPVASAKSNISGLEYSPHS